VLVVGDETDPLRTLRRALRIKLWFRVRQHLDRRPQFVDQSVAVTDLPALLETGQSIPKCQEPLAATLGSV
jgi:hypothetical protein